MGDIERLIREFALLEYLRARRHQEGPGKSYEFIWKDFTEQAKGGTDRDLKFARWYVENFLEPMGEGSSRLTYLLTSKRLLKLAKNEKGRAQNLAERRIAANPEVKGLVARVLDSADDGAWIVSELVRPLSDRPNAFRPMGSAVREFERLSGTSWNDFVEYVGRRDEDLKDLPHESREFIAYVTHVMRSAQLVEDDIVTINHWGKTADGRLVILDYGLDEPTLRAHYL